MARWPFRRKSQTGKGREKEISTAPIDKRATGLETTVEKAPDTRGRLSESSIQEKPRKLKKRRSRTRERDTARPKSVTPVKPERKADVSPTEGHDSGKEISEVLGIVAKDRRRRTRAREAHGDVPSYYFQNPTSHGSLPPQHPDPWQSPPTLRPTRSSTGPGLGRKKSGKRKMDANREEALRALTSDVPPMPTTPIRRPATHSGGPLGRESKMHYGLNRHFDRPTSDVSLPLPESVKSSIDLTGREPFRIRSLDVFSPRPTIVYPDNPRSSAGAVNTWGPSRSGSRKEKRDTIPEETLKESRTIDDLANDLDASSLRELMDRDARRREKKRILDRQKAQRKLERRAEKQRAEEEAVIGDTTIGNGVVNLERGPLGRGDAGLGIGAAESTAERRSSGESRRRSRRASQELKGDPHSTDPFADQEQAPEIPNATVGDIAGDPEPTPASERSEAVLGTATAIRMSTASMSPPRSPIDHARGESGISELSDLPTRYVTNLDNPSESYTNRRASDSNNRRKDVHSWTSFFKLTASKSKRDSRDPRRSTPSEFSNSRDSLPKQAPPAPAYRTSKRASSGIPERTKSKFREDLPETRMSPPESRFVSLEGRETAQSNRTGVSLFDRSGSAATSGDPFADRSIIAPSPDGEAASRVVSQSLASIDSEGSWLSGKPSAKRASQIHAHNYPLMTSTSSLQHTEEERESFEPSGSTGHASGGYDRSAVPSERTIGVHADPTESDEEELPEKEPGTWHDAVARQPIVIHGDPRLKSREGLLNEYLQGEDGSEPQTPSAGSPEDETPPSGEYHGKRSSVQRATSVDLGLKGHVRHLSAGSARLLEISKRSSMEPKSPE